VGLTAAAALAWYKIKTNKASQHDVADEDVSEQVEY
jgi:hypothetical protein